jgi:hypothetical protein
MIQNYNKTQLEKIFNSMKIITLKFLHTLKNKCPQFALNFKPFFFFVVNLKEFFFILNFFLQNKTISCWVEFYLGGDTATCLSATMATSLLGTIATSLLATMATSFFGMVATSLLATLANSWQPFGASSKPVLNK